jgi:hypothetical protein
MTFAALFRFSPSSIHSPVFRTLFFLLLCDILWSCFLQQQKTKACWWILFLQMSQGPFPFLSPWSLCFNSITELLFSFIPLFRTWEIFSFLFQLRVELSLSHSLLVGLCQGLFLSFPPVLLPTTLLKFLWPNDLFFSLGGSQWGSPIQAQPSLTIQI